MRHVIIEGPDGAGKTALARTLCQSLGMQYHHEGPPPPGVNRCEHYQMTLLSTDHPTVFDRFHLGELVYGPLLRGGTNLTAEEVDTINQTFKDMGGTMVCCLPPWETCIANNRRKEELIKDETVMRAAYDGWTLLVQTRAFNGGRVFDYTQEEPHVAS